ncbi:MAG: sugar-binding transcriptional regulator [Anaerolineae bacterium]|nr:sugar-binding transcriptional regulator [Anaerolineae bacterium]
MQISQEEHRLLYRIARAYYGDGQTQQEIAGSFGLSRPKVSRLLQRARDAGVVNITLVPPSAGLADLERELEARYGLSEASLVRVSDPDDSDLVARELGPAAAECLLRSVGDGSVIGLAWGRTILAMVEALPSQSFAGATVVQLNGGLGPVGALEHSTEVVRQVAQKLHAHLRLLPAPGMVSSVAAANVLRADYQISDVLQLAARSDVAVVGLGVPTPESVLLRDGNIVSEEDLQALQAAGAVGDVLLRYMDVDGNPVGLSLNQRIIGLSLEQLARIPRVIAVAGGTAKRQIIRAALKAGFVDVLVTDHQTAESLLGNEV